MEEMMKKCSICQRDYDGPGNNAEPINDGRCCNACNINIVLPTRIIHAYKNAIAQKKESSQ
jgi:hypothetical protein